MKYLKGKNMELGKETQNNSKTKWNFSCFVPQIHTKKVLCLLVFLLVFLLGAASVHSQSFGTSILNLNGLDVLKKATSLEFGPDGRLYVMELDGEIKIYSIIRNGVDDYEVTDAEVITTIKSIPNHYDDGTPNSTVKREATGITVVGTATNPIIYATSSDYQVGGPSGDKDLCTNSGVITRIAWMGTGINDPSGFWETVDLVRGLPRSEENHATNGLEQVNIAGKDYLIVTSGGSTNAGSPSKNFAWITEYALSAAILAVDLTVLESMPVQNDGVRDYIYDLPTLDDPTRPNQNGIEDPNDPAYDGIDVNDPWGGNDGLNQAKIEIGGPVQIFSPGYRNAYDLVATEAGAIYVTDNGANGGWGGYPENEGPGGNATNNYRPGEPGSGTKDGGENKVNNKDHLTLVTLDIQTYTFGSFYGGHPTPVRANPLGAGLFTRGSHSSDPMDLNGNSYLDDWFRTQPYDPNGMGDAADPQRALPADWPPVPLSLANPVEGDYRNPGETNPDGTDDILVTTWKNNTNGIDEYTASNFSNGLKGNLIAGKSGGTLFRVELNPDGSLKNLDQGFVTNIGGNPLGISCNSDFDPFPGTIWVGTFNANIVVLEPQDFFTCIDATNPSFDSLADYDADGYLNKDELENGTDYCNGGSQPGDFDKVAGGNLVSDLNDPDDDADSIADADDPFQLGNPQVTGSDAFAMPVDNELFSDDPVLQGYLGLGLTGLMNNGAPNPNWLQWLDKTDEGPNPNDILGGAIGAITMQMTGGTAFDTINTQEKAFQYGVQVDQNSGPVTISSKLLNFSGPLQLYQYPGAGELGIMMGDGTQHNYIKLVMTNNGVQFRQEVEDVPQSPLELTIPEVEKPGSSMILKMEVDPVTGRVYASYNPDENGRIEIGDILAEGKTLQALQSDTMDLAVGVIGTSNDTAAEVEGTWDYLKVFTSYPGIAKSFPLIEVPANSPPDTLDLDSFFVDLNPGNLSYAIISNSGTGVVPAIMGHQLELHYGPTPDTADILIRAENDGGFFVEQTLTVIITAKPIVLYRVNAGGNEVPAIDGSIPWAKDLSSKPYPYIMGGTNSTFSSNSIGITASVDTVATPRQIFDTERFNGPKASTDLTYSFPVSIPGEYEIRLFAGNLYDKTQNAGERVFDISIENTVLPELDNIDLAGQFGHKTGHMFSQIVNIQDGVIDITLLREIENPLINGIEIRGPAQPLENPIYVTPVADQENDENETVSFSVSAEGGDGVLNYSALNLPSGIFIDSLTGALSGTIDGAASQNSPYMVQVEVDDSDQSSGDKRTLSFQWTVIHVPVPISVDSIAGAQQYTETDSVNLPVIASGGNQTLIYSATQLPPGLMIDSLTGIISGVLDSNASENSPYLSQIVVDDSDGDTTDMKAIFLTWNISPLPIPISIVPLDSQSNFAGDTVALALNASGGNNFLSYSATGLPPGIQIDSLTGEISGILDSLAVYGSPYSPSFYVDDNDGDTTDITSVSIDWEIFHLPIPINIEPLSKQTNLINDTATLILRATGGNGFLSYSATGLPPGIQIDSGTGIMSGVIDSLAVSGSPYNILVTVDDNDVDTTDFQSLSFSWFVNPIPVNMVLGSMPDREDVEKDSVTFPVNASGGDNPLVFSASGLPQGVSIHPDSGIISGVIDSGSSGASPFQVTVSVDDNDNDFKDIQYTHFTWKINPFLDPFCLSPITFQSNIEGDSLMLPVEVKGGSGIHSFRAKGLPPGLTINSGSGVISGTIDSGASQSSLFHVTIIVTDSVILKKASTTFSWGIEAPSPSSIPIVLESIAGQSGTEGDAISLSVNATGGDGSLTYAAFGLPAGLLLDSVTGAISGTIDTGAASLSPFHVVVTVNDADTIKLNDVKSTSFNWNVAPVIPEEVPIVAQTVFHQENDVNDSVSLQIMASGGDGNLRFTAAGLPPGTGVDSSSGLITGFIQAGADTGSPFQVAVTVDDSDTVSSDAQSISFDWKINSPASIPIMISPVAERVDSVGDSVSFFINASGGDSALNYSATGLPKSVSLDSATGSIFGILTEENSGNSPYHVEVYVDDNDDDNTDVKSIAFNWTIHKPAPLPVPVVLDSIPNQTNDEGDVVSFQVNASGGDTTLIYTVSSLPPGVMLDPINGNFSGIIDTGASSGSPYLVTVKVDDADGDTTDIQFTSFEWVINTPIPVSNPIIVDTISDQINEEGEVVSLSVIASGGDTTLLYTALGVPPGVSLDPLMGNFSGTIDTGAASGSPYLVMVKVDDADGDTSDFQSMSFNWTVNQPIPISNPIILDSIPAQASHETDTVYLTVNASGGDGMLSYSASGLPPGLTIHPDSGYISGIIDSAASDSSPYVTMVYVDDADLDTLDRQSLSFNWVVSTTAPGWIDLDEDENYTARHECSFVQAGEHFYLFGGRENPKKLDTYDYLTNTWTTSAQAPIPFNHFQAVEYQGYIWVIGAFKENNFPSEPPADRIYLYDVAADKWIDGPMVPVDRRRGSAGLAVYNDKFYVVSGNKLGHKENNTVAWVDEYDPATNTWTQLADIPHPRDHFHVAVVGNKLYAAGGRKSSHPTNTFAPLVPEVDVYDFTTGTWSTLPTGSNVPTPRAAPAVGLFNNEIFLMGGEGDGQAYNTVEALDPVTGTWSTKPAMNYPRHGTQAIVSGDGLYITAGSPKQGGGKQHNMEVFGKHNPDGTIVAAGSIGAPSIVEFMPGDILNIPVTNSGGGNQGIFITSVEISGVDASLFNVINGPVESHFIQNGDSMDIQVEFTGTAAGASAEIIIHYGADQSIVIPFSSIQS